MICVDGGQGLIAALPIVCHTIPVQRCWAHKMRNILNKVRKADHDAVKADLHAVMNAPNRRKAETAARRFADRREPVYPKAVACLRNDLDDLFTCLRSRPLPSRSWSGPPMPLNDGSERSDAAPGPWEPSRTGPPWIASSFTKTRPRDSVPQSR